MSVKSLRRRGKVARRRDRVCRRARFSAPDPSVTGCAGVLALAELVDLLGVVGHVDEEIGPIKTRERGVSGGQLLVALGQAQLAGADYLSGMDTHRGDIGVGHLGAAPVPASTTVGGWLAGSPPSTSPGSRPAGARSSRPRSSGYPTPAVRSCWPGR